MSDQLMDKTMKYSRSLFAEDFSGHDWAHTERVYKIAKNLAQAEGADVLIVSVAALLHDADDRKLFPETWREKANAVSFLHSEGCEPEFIDRVLTIIDEVSFRGTDSVVPTTLEGKCVQDADRLDAMGAIGIARAFTFGGSRSRTMYDPMQNPRSNIDSEAYFASESTTINHFYEKLLLLKDMMNTSAAKEIAAGRHAFMQEFLDEFYAEWEGRL